MKNMEIVGYEHGIRVKYRRCENYKPNWVQSPNCANYAAI